MLEWLNCMEGILHVAVARVFSEQLSFISDAPQVDLNPPFQIHLGRRLRKITIVFPEFQMRAVHLTLSKRES